MKHTLVFHVIGLSKKLQNNIGLNAQVNSLSNSQASTLLILDSQEKTSQIDIARSLHLKPPSVVTLVDELEKLKLVRRHTHPQSRRAYQIKLTPLGKTEAQKVKRQAFQLESLVKASLTKDEYKAFTSAVNKLSRKIDEQNSNGKGVKK